MADLARIRELRRRVERAPASIAFARPAVECRRLGDFDEVVRTARAGLEYWLAAIFADRVRA